MKKFAIKQGDSINKRLVFNSPEEANEKWWEMKPEFISENLEVVPVWEFLIWFRIHDDKDFIEFYSSNEDVDQAIEEAIKEVNFAFAIDLVGIGVVAKYNERIENEELNQLKLNYENIS